MFRVQNHLSFSAADVLVAVATGDGGGGSGGAPPPRTAARVLCGPPQHCRGLHGDSSQQGAGQSILPMFPSTIKCNNTHFVYTTLDNQGYGINIALKLHYNKKFPFIRTRRFHGVTYDFPH